MKKSCAKRLRNEKKAVHLQPKTTMVPWMSGLVNGLQNRLQQFESARHLHDFSIEPRHIQLVARLFCFLPICAAVAAPCKPLRRAGHVRYVCHPRSFPYGSPKFQKKKKWPYYLFIFLFVSLFICFSFFSFFIKGGMGGMLSFSFFLKRCRWRRKMPRRDVEVSKKRRSDHILSFVCLFVCSFICFLSLSFFIKGCRGKPFFRSLS